MKIKGILLFDFNTKLCVKKSSHIILGKHIVSDGRCVIMVDQDAQVKIGDRVYFNEGTMISAKKKVIIDSGCKFGPGVKVFDNDHCFDRKHGVCSEHRSSDIKIGKDCWIASNVVILRGTEIGEKCVIGAGCVIKGKIPKHSLVTADTSLKIVPIKEM